MSLAKKYSGLPDLDASQEIYETPALTDDASTIQTDTLRTDSPTPSDEDHSDERVVRERIDQNSARRRFEPTLVHAKDVNFSDTIAAGERRSYRTSDDETLAEKITRLKREAEEVRIALQDKQAEPVPGIKVSKPEEAAHSDDTAVDELQSLINGLDTSAHSATRGSSREEALLKSLSNPTSATTNGDSSSTKPQSQPQPDPSATQAAIADRLTALETALGLPSISTSPPSILPALDHLTTQLDTLTSTLLPPSRTGINPPTLTPTTPNLDDLHSRIQHLTSEADKLTASRKAALASLSDLHDARLRYNAAARHTHSSSARHTSDQASKSDAAPATQQLDAKEAQIHAQLFLSEQSSKITALYQLLPSITSLQPLLPLVLDRLRSLSVIHAGAAEARGELDDVVARQAEARQEIAKWRTAVEGVEAKIEELKGEMRENVGVLGTMVQGVEGRVKALQTKEG
ncbi:uncharacterized protein AB675_8959 [Cyphellophora attinorum]|uniref:Dynactin subunit 2 n=1 Tax=Cyphellophora attinorum TaxID=1664694 RepID=A0A0N1H5F7_9EURO|nr:uncharacterized protein AB675_8959 [Phialophora attinorum]KPI36233.1 hypothetical protein AB675_8959 [Phialophora attinorum]